MSNSTLIPFWLETLIVGVSFFVLAGLFAPYISGEEQEKARKVDRFFNEAPVDGLVPITIRSRVDLPGLGFFPILMLLAVVDVAFFLEEYEVVAGINPFISGMIMLIVDHLLLLTIQSLMSLAATIIQTALENYYKGKYFVEVKCDTEVEKIGIHLGDI